MNDNKQRLITLTIGLCLIITIILIIRTCDSGYNFWNSSQVEFDVTGQIGDFIGGVVGTILSAIGFYFLYITFLNQRTSFEKERLESKYFDLVKLHRDNVSELHFDGQKLAESYDSLFIDKILYEGKSVFRVIFNQFIICKNELDPFFRPNKIYQIDYERELLENSYVKQNNINIVTLAKLDVCFCIVFYGVSSEGLLILNDLFKDRYKPKFINDVLRFISLKPAFDKQILKKWEVISGRNTRSKRTDLVGQIYDWRATKTLDTASPFHNSIKDYHNRFVKYYGGHQFRLGHYFRHLYMTVKYINNQENLDYKTKYEYIKILRCQLSTYEQAILFINSLSILGRAWEVRPEIDNTLTSYNQFDFELVTKYNLIKNLPGEVIYGIPFKKFYPNVEYESENEVKQRHKYK